MSNTGKIFLSLLTAILFISIHAEKPACIDYMASVIASVKSMEGTYTKEINALGEKVKTKVTFFDDAVKGKKHLTVSDSKGMKNEIYVLGDTLFILDKISKEIYYVNIEEYGELGRKMFELNVFESLSILSALEEHDSVVSVTDKSGKLNVSFISDTSNPVYSMIIVRLTKDSLPELIEMYDWNGKVMLQLQYSKFKDKLPTAIRALTKTEGGVIDEKISISKLKLNTEIPEKNFKFDRKGFKMLSLKEAFESLMK